MDVAILVGILMPILGTMFGSAFVFFMKHEMPVRLQKALLGFAEASQGAHSNISTIGFAIGFVLMMVLDVVLGKGYFGAINR